MSGCSAIRWFLHNRPEFKEMLIIRLVGTKFKQEPRSGPFGAGFHFAVSSRPPAGICPGGSASEL